MMPLQSNGTNYTDKDNKMPAPLVGAALRAALAVTAKKAATRAAAKKAAPAVTSAAAKAAAAKAKKAATAKAVAATVARQKAAGVTVLKAGTKPLSPKTPAPGTRGPFGDILKPIKKPVVVNSSKVKGVTTNNKGNVNWGNSKTSKDKIKYGS
jgi:sulfite reductase alpha subunit-like flavoprotein